MHLHYLNPNARTVDPAATPMYWLPSTLYVIGPPFQLCAGVEVPQQLAVLRVRRDECAAAVSIEDQAAGRRHQSACENPAADVRDLPRCFSRLNVDRLEKLSAAFARRTARSAAVERFARLPPLVVLAIDVARLLGEHVEEPGRRVVRVGRPVCRARNRRADQLAFDGRLVRRQQIGTAVRADAAGPGQLLDEWLGHQHLPREPVQHVEESVAIALQHELARLAAETWRRPAPASPSRPNRAGRAA